MVICRLDENGGPGIARNKGLDLVIEDNIPYIVFADADDCFGEYISLQVLLMEIQEADFVVSEFYEANEQVDLNRIKDCDVWLFGKMYKTEIIKNNNILFMPIPENEDVCFNLWYYLSCNTTHAVSNITYYWLFNKNSITRKNDYEYSNYCGIGLMKNLIPTYKAIFNNKNISEEKILHSLANRIIRAYLNYKKNYNLWDSEVEKKNLQALKEFYKEIYQKKEDLITEEIFLIEWSELLTGEVYYRDDLSFNNFIKKIRED